MKDPNAGLLTMAFSMVTPVGAMYEALSTALTQFVENTADEDELSDKDKATLAAARAMMDTLDSRHAKLADRG